MSESASVIVETGLMSEGNTPQTGLTYGPNGRLLGVKQPIANEVPIVDAETVITPESAAEDKIIDEIIKNTVVGNDLLPAWLKQDTSVAHSVIGMVRGIRAAAEQSGAEITDSQIFTIYYDTWQQSLKDQEVAKLASPAVEVDLNQSAALAEQTLFIGSLLVEPMNPDSKLPF